MFRFDFVLFRFKMFWFRYYTFETKLLWNKTFCFEIILKINFSVENLFISVFTFSVLHIHLFTACIFSVFIKLKIYGQTKTWEIPAFLTCTLTFPTFLGLFSIEAVEASFFYTVFQHRYLLFQYRGADFSKLWTFYHIYGAPTLYF